MPISFSLRLQDTEGRSVPIADYRVHRQIVLAGEADSWPRTIAFSLNAADPVTERRLEQFFDQQGNRSFTFTAMRAGDGVRLVGQAPAGTYTLGVMIEDLRLQKEPLPLKIAEGYSDTVTAIVLPDARTVRHVRAFDPAIERLLRASTLEGENGIDWLADLTKRDSDVAIARRRSGRRPVPGLRGRGAGHHVAAARVERNLHRMAAVRGWMHPRRRAISRVSWAS